MKFKNSLNQITKRKKWQLTEKHYIYRIYKCDNFSQRQPRFGRENKGLVIIEGGFIAWRLSCISKAFLWFSCFTQAAGFWGTRKYSGSRDTARSRRQQQLSWYSDKVGPKNLHFVFIFIFRTSKWKGVLNWRMSMAKAKKILYRHPLYLILTPWTPESPLNRPTDCCRRYCQLVELPRGVAEVPGSTGASLTWPEKDCAKSTVENSWHRSLIGNEGGLSGIRAGGGGGSTAYTPSCFFTPRVIAQSWDYITIQAREGMNEWWSAIQEPSPGPCPRGSTQQPPSSNLATASWMSSQLHLFHNLSMSLLRVGKETMPLREKIGAFWVQTGFQPLLVTWRWVTTGVQSLGSPVQWRHPSPCWAAVRTKWRNTESAQHMIQSEQQFPCSL